jgi:DNA-binding NarL/FixJ family response regulator
MQRVLIVEDDRDFAEILKESLEEDPSVVVSEIFTCEEDAMNFVRSGGLQEIDCVLCDLMLPRWTGAPDVNSMSGLRLVREMRQVQRFSGTIVVLTNSREIADGERALAAGCDGYLCKHAPAEEVSLMLTKLRLALRGDIVLVSREMRHVFLREELSVKEARLMELLNAGKTWAEVATELGYKTPKAAANIGYRVFDKMLTDADKHTLGSDGDRKRTRALERWRARLGLPAIPVPPPAFTAL